jgi:hypothetical protein
MSLRSWRRDEIVCNCLALFGVVLSATAVLFHQNVLSPWSGSQIDFIRNVLLLDFSHVFFTYLSLHEVPEMRQWVEQKTNGRTWLFWLGVLCTLILFFTFSYTFHSVDGGSTTIRSLFFFTIATMPVIHAIRQTKGLAQLQTRIHGDAKAEKREATMFQLFLALVLIRENPFWQSQITDNLILAGELLLVVGLFVQAFLLERGRPKQKTAFLVRMFAYMFHNHPVVFATIGAIHGTDYLRITQLQVANSSMDSSSRKFFFRLMIVGISIAGIIWMPRLFATAREARFATALGFALIYTHYFLDFFIYRMKDPVSRQFVAPLLRFLVQEPVAELKILPKAS